MIMTTVTHVTVVFSRMGNIASRARARARASAGGRAGLELGLDTAPEPAGMFPTLGVVVVVVGVGGWVCLSGDESVVAVGGVRQSRGVVLAAVSPPISVVELEVEVELVESLLPSIVELVVELVVVTSVGLLPVTTSE